MRSFVGDLIELRNATSTVQNPANWLLSLFGGITSKSGQKVNPETALTHMAVWDAVWLLTTTVACLPLTLYRRTEGGGKERAREHPLYQLMSARPNDWQTSFEWREMIVGHLELRGNAYNYIDLDMRTGRINRLVPLHPDRVTVWQTSEGVIWYEYRPKYGPTQKFAAPEILHLRGLASDGVVGYNPIALARETIGVALAQNDFAATFYGKSATPGGVLQHKGKLGKDAYNRLKDSFDGRYAGAENAGKTLILEEGLEWKQLGMTSRDAQFLELRKFGVAEIARLFHVPLHLLKDLDRATFSNIEQQSIDFVTYSLGSRLVRIEQRLNESLLLEREQGEYFFKFNVDALLRGDLKTRYEAYAIGRNWGWLSANDVREREDENRLPGDEGDIYLQPTNMGLPGDGSGNPKPGAAPKPGTPAPADDPANDGGDGASRAQLIAAARHVIADAFHRAATREANACRKQLERSTDLGEFERWHAYFWQTDQHDHLRSALTPAMRLVVDLAELRDPDAQTTAFCEAAASREMLDAGIAMRTAARAGIETLRTTLDTWADTRAAAASPRERDTLTRTLPRGPDAKAA